MTNSDHFDHSFDGWSVWLEPCPNESSELFQHVEALANECGGSDCGLHVFVPHCTLLYNVARHTLDAHDGVSDKRIGQDLLQQTLDDFRRRSGLEQSINAHQHDELISSNDSSQVQLMPKNFYFFEYPKHADQGRGFGCVISLILLEKTRQLQLLYDSVSTIFPPDERQDFTPHVSLVYAPESKAKWLESYTEKMAAINANLLTPFRARYLSLWSTEGKIADWFRIAQIELYN